MTKKDFIALARIVSEAHSEDGAFNGEWGRDVLAESLADYCEKKNPLFNRTVFLKCCGVSDDG